MTATKTRGKSALSRYLAQRTAERDRPDASAPPVEERPVPEVEAASGPKPSRKRRLVRPALEPVAEAPTVVEPAPKLRARRKAKPVREPKAAEAPVVEPAAVEPPVVEEPAVAEPEPARGPGPLRPKAKATKARPGDPIKVVKPSKLTPFVDKIGVLTDAEVARMAGVTPTNVQLWRRRRGIPPARGAKAASARPPLPEPLVTTGKLDPAPLVGVEPPIPVEVAFEVPAHEVAPEPVVVQKVVRIAPTGQHPTGRTPTRTVWLTDRVEGMLLALAKARGIDPDAAISVAIAEDYVRCQAIVQGE